MTFPTIYGCFLYSLVAAIGLVIPELVERGKRICENYFLEQGHKGNRRSGAWRQGGRANAGLSGATIETMSRVWDA